MAVIRSIGIGALAGLAAGLIVGGLGGRIAMRISGAMSDPDFVGSARTANGNIVGDVTLGGSIAMFMFGAFVPSMAAGLWYGVMRPWLLPLGVWRGPLFGFALLALAGSLILEPTNFDFRRFGSPQVNVLTFATLIVLLGLAIAWSAEALGQLTRRKPFGVLAWIGVLLVLALIAGFVVVVIAAALEIAAGHLVNAEHVNLLLLLLAFALPLGLRLTSGRGSLGDRSGPTSRPRLASYLAVGAVPLLALPRTIDLISLLLR